MAASTLVDQARALFGPKLDAVEVSLTEELGDCDEFLREHAGGVLRSGGKRLRPILHLLSSGLLGYEGERDVKYATVFEYVHVASLLHDDVIDDADLRRGTPSLNRKLGNTLSVLVGDFLCVKALALAAQQGHAQATDLIARTTLDLVAGESLQERSAGRLDLAAEECLRIIDLKTARLMASACEVAGFLPGVRATAEQRAMLREYGSQLGLAFQLADDILDFASDEETLGKPVLSDLREGKLTLPAILALQDGGTEARTLVSAVMEDGGFQRVSPARIVSLVTDSGALEATTARAHEAAARARAALGGFPEGPALEALLYITDFAVTRVS